MTLTPFHLAFPVNDLETTRRFYCDVLGCEPGRSSETWFDFSLFGHQMSAHIRTAKSVADSSGAVDGKAVPIPHFGVVLLMDDWKALAARLEAADGIDWLHRPMIRFAGEPGEQATLFIRDPSGNALEFKGFASLDAVFAH
jgi:extradiol dioxygenase family protein